MPLFLLLVAVPIIEIALFIELGGWIGLWWAIAIVVLTAIAGTALLRAQGLATLAELQRQLAAGENPGPTIAHGAMILVAGVLLLTPGFFTDTVGFLLLAPPVRAAVIRIIGRRIMVAQVHMHAKGQERGQSEAGTVEGEFEVVDPDGEAGGTGGASGWTQVPGDRRTD